MRHGLAWALVVLGLYAAGRGLFTHDTPLFLLGMALAFSSALTVTEDARG